MVVGQVRYEAHGVGPTPGVLRLVGDAETFWKSWKLGSEEKA